MSLKHKTVLIVDDDQDMLKLLEKILSGAGFSVMAADNPETARKILFDNPPHVIISDLHMEPEDGFAFIKSIKINRQYAHLPILVLSALNDFGSVKKAIALGVSDYVIKPLQSQMLVRKLRKVLYNKDFARWEIPDSSPIFLPATFSAEVVALGETGFTLNGPFKLGAARDIKFEAREFREMTLDQCLQRTSHLNQTYQNSGMFSNDVTFVGIGEQGTSRIRQFLLKKAGP